MAGGEGGRSKKGGKKNGGGGAGTGFNSSYKNFRHLTVSLFPADIAAGTFPERTRDSPTAGEGR